MGWGVQLTTDVYVSRVTKDRVETTIEENDNLIKMLEKELFMLVSSNPREIASEEARNDGSIIEELRIKVDEILESYRDCVNQNARLQIIFEEIGRAEDC
jgi:hypothetical protein